MYFAPRFRRCLLALALIFVVGFIHAEELDALGRRLQAQGYAPLDLRGNLGAHMETVARVNGVRGLFLIDTGAQITVINRASLRRFHLTPVKTAARVYGALGGPGERIEAALAGKLQVGPCKASPFLVGVSDLSALNDARRTREGRRFDGIIGADALQNFGMIIDCDRLRLYGRAEAGQDGVSPEAPGGLGDYLRGQRYLEVPMKRSSISDFEVQSNVNGRRALWLVDTGAAVTLLDTKLSRRAGIKINRTNLSVGGAGGGRRRIAVGVMDTLKLNSVKMRSALIAISDISASNAALQEDGKPVIDGYLGADFLRGRGALIDCAGMKLYLQR